MISDSRQSYNPVKFEDSFVIQPELTANISPTKNNVKNSNLNSLNKNFENSLQTSPHRYSTNNTVNYSSNTNTISRSSAPVNNLKFIRKPNLQANEIKNGNSDLDDNKSRSNKWENYQFKNSKDRSYRGKKIYFLILKKKFLFKNPLPLLLQKLKMFLQLSEE